MVRDKAMCISDALLLPLVFIYKIYELQINTI